MSGGIQMRALVLVLGVTLAACGATLRRFPLAAPVWEDPDRNPVPGRVSDYFSGDNADLADQSILRPLSQLFAFALPGEARNVNAVDEVPNSAWFVNRIGLYPMTPERVARGSCVGAPLDPGRGPWYVMSAKTEGVSGGFFIRAPQGKFLLKFDGRVGPERATAADVIGSKIYWAAGYRAPCNEIVFFRRKVLRLGKNAMGRDRFGRKSPLTEKVIDKVLGQAFRLKDGRIRAVASAVLPGKVLGPFRFEGTRGDDPNDVIPHEDRRELRGSRLLAAWTQHFDSREQNTLDTFVNESGRPHVRHHFIDFGDCFTSGKFPNEAVTRRIGHSYFIDYQDILVDLLTLGMLPRPWNRAKINTEAEIFGYYGVREFVPSKWKPAYPNPAFERMTARDALWMVRIISRFTDRHLHAIVKRARFRDRRVEKHLKRILIGRRNAILKEYLTRYAPLDRFLLVRRAPGRLEQSLCFEDLAVKVKVIEPGQVLYKLRFYGGAGWKKELGWLQFAPDPKHPHRSCVVLPIGDRRPADLAPRGARDDHPLRYGVLKIFIHQKPAIPPTSSVWLHFYDLGPKRGYRLVGIERQPEPVPPNVY